MNIGQADKVINTNTNGAFQKVNGSYENETNAQKIYCALFMVL